MSGTDYLVKGTPTMNTRDWLDEQLGEGWFHRTIQYKFDDWPQRLLPGEFYPLAPQIHAFEAALRQIDGYDDVEYMVREAAARTAEQDLKTIYKAFLWAASPRTFLRAVPRLWSSYVRFSELITTQNESGSYQATITAVPQECLGWSAGAVVGLLRPALILAGGQNPTSAITGRRRAEDGYYWEFDYQLTYE